MIEKFVWKQRIKIYFFWLGAFGEVRKALHKVTGTVRAVKIINKNITSDEEQKRLINEVEISKRLVMKKP